jgi:hypothetical protein
MLLEDRKSHNQRNQDSGLLSTLGAANSDPPG